MGDNCKQSAALRVYSRLSASRALKNIRCFVQNQTVESECMCKRCMMENSSQVCSYSVHGKQSLDQSPDSMIMFSAKHSQMFSPTDLSIVDPHSQSGRSIPTPAGGPQ